MPTLSLNLYLNHFCPRNLSRNALSPPGDGIFHSDGACRTGSHQAGWAVCPFQQEVCILRSGMSCIFLKVFSPLIISIMSIMDFQIIPPFSYLMFNVFVLSFVSNTNFWQISYSHGWQLQWFYCIFKAISCSVVFGNSITFQFCTCDCLLPEIPSFYDVLFRFQLLPSPLCSFMFWRLLC